MALTITEKQHWKERIESRIDKRIKRLKAGNLDFFTGITEQARTQAIAQAQLTKEFSRLAAIEETESELASEKQNLLDRIYTSLIGKHDSSIYYVRNKIDTRISELQRQIEEDLLEEHVLGREIANLATEKENLLDTVWLATSPREVTDLWKKVLNLLGEDTTEFQQEVLSAKKSSAG